MTKGKSKSSVMEIEIPAWVKRGIMLVRRECLDPGDKDSDYNYVLSKYPGVDPADFGIKTPGRRCDKCGSHLDPDEGP